MSARREAALILAVAIAMAAAFVASYTPALDRPAPRHIPTALVGPPADDSALARRLDARVDGALVDRKPARSPQRRSGPRDLAPSNRRGGVLEWRCLES